jgi:hypothetical protein
VPLFYTYPEAESCWSRVADVLSAETIGKGTWRIHPVTHHTIPPYGDLCLSAVVDGVAVQIEARGEGGFETYILALADDDGLTLRVKHGYVYPIGRALGIQDITVGDADFDERFIIKSNDESFCRARLDAELRGMMLAAAEYAFELGDGKVTATTVGVEIDARVLEHAARAVARLAGGRRRLLAGLAECLGARSGRRGVEVDVGDLVCHIDTTRLRRHQVTRITATAGENRREIDRHAPWLADLLAVARPDRLELDGDEVTLAFHGWMEDVDRLRAGLDAVAAIAGPDRRPEDGPYR